MWCGTEDFLYKQNTQMRKHLTKHGYNLVYEESPGDHQWKYWDAKIQTILDWLIPGKEDA
jgi:enterochelin esterase-like enzyme